VAIVGHPTSLPDAVSKVQGGGLPPTKSAGSRFMAARTNSILHPDGGKGGYILYLVEGAGLALIIHEVTLRGRRGDVPGGDCDPRGAQAYLTVRRAP
jgi:hypothetical protein